MLPNWLKTMAESQKSSLTGAQLGSLMGYLEHDPDNLKLLADAAAAAIDEANPSQAVLLLERHRQLAPLTPALMNLEGLAALQQQRYADAARIFEALLPQAPAESALRFNLAWCRAMTADFAAADALLDAETVRANSEAATLKIQSLHHLGMLNEALAWGDELSRLFPANHDLTGKLSIIALDAEDLSLAARYAAMAGNQHDGLAATGMIQLGEDRLSEAETTFRRALALSPEDARALLGQGLARLSQGDPKGALGPIDRAAELFERHLGSWVASGWTYLVLGDRTTSRARFERALSIDNTFAEIHGGLAVLDLLDGDVESARRRTDVALRLDRRCFSAALATSMLLDRGGEHARAERVRDVAMNLPIGVSGRTLAQSMAALGLGARRH